MLQLCGQHNTPLKLKSLNIQILTLFYTVSYCPRGSALYLGLDQQRCVHLGFSEGRLNSNLLGSAWLLGFPEAAVLGLTQLREVGMFVLLPDVRQNP